MNLSHHNWHSPGANGRANPGSDLHSHSAWWHLLLGQTHQSKRQPQTVHPCSNGTILPSPTSPNTQPPYPFPGKLHIPLVKSKHQLPTKAVRRVTVTIGFLPGRPWDVKISETWGPGKASPQKGRVSNMPDNPNTPPLIMWSLLLKSLHLDANHPG